MDIDGKKIAKEVLDEIRLEIQRHQIKPGIAFVLVGEDAASQTYVRMKGKACQEVGILSKRIDLPGSVSEDALLKVIAELNDNPDIHGILVQMPLPSHINEKNIILAVDPKKDVDGFHPYNLGKMVLGDEDCFIPCTPFGILRLLEAYHVETSGKNVTIVGRSNIVGKPIANLLLQKRKTGNATVTIAHSQTPHLSTVTKNADILIAAIGRPKFITKEMVKQGAVVIDVGINRTEEGIVGDVDYKNVAPLASLITPVPGGVGPMTIAMLLYNTLKSAKSLL